MIVMKAPSSVNGSMPHTALRTMRAGVYPTPRHIETMGTGFAVVISFTLTYFSATLIAKHPIAETDPASKKNIPMLKIIFFISIRPYGCFLREEDNAVPWHVNRVRQRKLGPAHAGPSLPSRYPDPGVPVREAYRRLGDAAVPTF